MNVEFKLFGNFLTLREFVFIALGVAISWFLWFLANSKILPGILVYPLILVIGGGGVISALVPIQGRTLDQWLVNFLAAMKRPTQMIWKKAGFVQPLPASAGQQEVVTKEHVIAPPVTQVPATSANVAPAQKTDDKAVVTVEKEEQKRLGEIETTITAIDTGRTPIIAEEPSQKAVPAANTAANTDESGTVYQPAKSPTPQSSDTSGPAPYAEPIPEEPIPSASAQSVPIVAQNATPQPVADPSSIVITDDTITGHKTEIADLEQINNTINIVILDRDNNPCPQVTCIIRDEKGEPVRAGISNMLGQIIHKTPLSPGTYTIFLSRQGYIFPKISWTLSDKIYPPIAVQAL